MLLCTYFVTVFDFMHILFRFVIVIQFQGFRLMLLMKTQFLFDSNLIQIKLMLLMKTQFLFDSNVVNENPD